MQNYRKLKIWERSHSLVLEIYRLTRAFPKEEIFGITAQLRRAASSVPANIVEGSARSSDPDFSRFLNIALGSLNELDYFLMLSRDLSYLDNKCHLQLQESIDHLRKMMISMITRLKRAQ